MDADNIPSRAVFRQVVRSDYHLSTAFLLGRLVPGWNRVLKKADLDVYRKLLWAEHELQAPAELPISDRDLPSHR